MGYPEVKVVQGLEDSQDNQGQRAFPVCKASLARREIQVMTEILELRDPQEER